MLHMDIIKKKSPNFNDRVGDAKPDYIVLHYTGTKDAQEACEAYMDSSVALSPHYMVDVDGTITQFVDEDKRAWHAGKSSWGGCEDMNSASIGIEIVNGGHAHGLPEYPADQIEALITLCKDVIARHDIPPLNILGHSDISTGRKVDPGENFPWEYLADNGVGFWPHPDEDDYKANIGVRSGLLGLGYSSQCEDVVLIREFQRRYQPEIFHKNATNVVCEYTHALVNALLREKHR